MIHYKQSRVHTLNVASREARLPAHRQRACTGRARSVHSPATAPLRCPTPSPAPRQVRQGSLESPRQLIGRLDRDVPLVLLDRAKVRPMQATPESELLLKETASARRRRTNSPNRLARGHRSYGSQPLRFRPHPQKIGREPSRGRTR
jgi:hypothetical protein